MVTFFYIISIQFYRGSTLTMSTQSQQITARPGDNRQTLYARALDDITTAQGVEKTKTIVVYFYLEPVELNMVDLADLME